MTKELSLNTKFQVNDRIIPDNESGNWRIEKVGTKWAIARLGDSEIKRRIGLVYLVNVFTPLRRGFWDKTVYRVYRNED